MTTRSLSLVLACVAMLLGPAAVLGQQLAPTPMPRPADRMPATLPDQAVETISESTAAAAEVPQSAVPASARDASGAATATEAVAAIAQQRQPVTLSARITENGMNIPEGLVWRVFDTRTDATGELALAEKSDRATAVFQLAPGEYVVHVAYGRAQASETIEVASGGVSKSLVLDAGAMRLNAAVTGEVPIPINLLRFDIFTAGSENERTVVAQGLAANDVVTLNAGTYHVISYFGATNAVVRADLRVEPGQLTDATLYHRASQVTFKLVTETGGEAIADVDWTVKTAGGQTVFSDIGAFPATVLAEGDYLVLAKRGETVYNREFEVQPGQSREVEVLTTVY